MNSVIWCRYRAASAAVETAARQVDDVGPDPVPL